MLVWWCSNWLKMIQISFLKNRSAILDFWILQISAIQLLLLASMAVIKNLPPDIFLPTCTVSKLKKFWWVAQKAQTRGLLAKITQPPNIKDVATHSGWYLCFQLPTTFRPGFEQFLMCLSVAIAIEIKEAKKPRTYYLCILCYFNPI